MSYPDFPEEWWGELGEGPHTCSALSGTYENSGYADRTSQWSPQLHSIMFENAKDIDEPDRIELDFGEDRVMRVRASKDGAVLAETAYSESESSLTCDDSGAEIRAYRGMTRGMTNPVVGYEYGSATLMKAVDGALIVRSSSGGAGLAYLIFPVAGGQRNWYRFAPAE